MVDPKEKLEEGRFAPKPSSPCLLAPLWAAEDGLLRAAAPSLAALLLAPG